MWHPPMLASAEIAPDQGVGLTKKVGNGSCCFLRSVIVRELIPIACFVPEQAAGEA